MRFFSFPQCLIILFFALFSLCPLATANVVQDTPSVLQEVLVSASAEPDALKNIPANVQVITPLEIERSGATTLTQLLGRTSAVNTLVLPGNFSRFTMRGFSSGKSVSNTFSDQVLLLIDGNRTGTGNLDNIPIASIERVEILRGPASVLYGGSAVGGIINVITKKGKGPLKGKIAAEAGSYGHYNAKAGLSGGLADDVWGFSVTAQTNHSDDYDTGRGRRYKNSSYNKSGGGATATWRPHEGTSVSGVFAMQEVYDTGSPGDIYWSTPNSKTSSSWGYGSVELDSHLDNGVSLKGSLYANQNRYEDDNREAFPYTSRFTSRMLGARAVVGLPLPEVKLLDLGRLAIGAEYALHKQELGGNSISEPDNKTDIYSVFLEHKFSLLPSVTVQYGLRYDLYDSKTKNNSGGLGVRTGSDTFEHLTWSAGATWWMLDWLGLRSSVGTAYVPPTSMQLSGEYTSWGTTYVGNPDLNAEKSLTWEIGLDFERSGVFGSVGYFQTRYKDRITLRDLPSPSPMTPIREYVNQGRQDVAGLEATLRYSGSFAVGERTLTVSPYGNWEHLFERKNKGDNVTTSKITDLPRYTGLAGLGLGLDKIPLLRSLWFDVNAQFVGDHHGYDFATGRYKDFSSFILVNARLSVSPVENLTVYLDARNLEDKYYGYKPEFPMPGRMITVGVSYEF
jgi:Outer membrane receptor for ferrienterochelin and colicins